MKRQRGSRPAALPVYQLKTQEERSALHSLRLPEGDESKQKEFRTFVLKHLAIVEKSGTHKGGKDSVRRTCSDEVKNLKRIAKRTRKLAEYLKERSGSGFFSLSEPPINELFRYSDSLDSTADSLRTRGFGLIAAPSGGLPIRKGPPRREKTQQVGLIVSLIDFVQEHTGEGHWKELAILLRSATNDKGCNQHRLQSICSLRRKQNKEQNKALNVRLAAMRGRPH